MVAIATERGGLYDLSFMYTRRCDLMCPFCMYSSSPEVNDALDLNLLQAFLGTVNFSMIRSCGLYGGEPAVEIVGFGRVAEMLPLDVPKFVITNGAWSQSDWRTFEFLTWVVRYDLRVFVSGTVFHRKHQDRKRLEALEKRGWLTLKKPDENFLPMGKLEGRPVQCTRKCAWADAPLRIAVTPDAKLIYQSCDGIYPTIGNIEEGFSALHDKIMTMRDAGFGMICPHWETATQRRFE